jgi:hypothetical protein
VKINCAFRRAFLSAAIFAAAGCLFAADTDVSKTLSPDFVKAGLKALITARNSIKLDMTKLDQSRVQSALDDAEIAAAAEADKAAFSDIKRFRFTLETYEFRAQTRMLDLQLKLMYKNRRQMEQITNEELNDPEMIKDQAAKKACGDALEKMLRSGNLVDVPECDATKTDPPKEMKP